MPLAVLKSRVLIDAQLPESERFMQCDAGGIGQRNSREGGMKSLPAQSNQQFAIESPSNTGTARSFIHIGGDIHRPAIGGTFAMLSGIGITGHHSIPFGDQPGMGWQRRGDALGHLSRRGWLGFE